MAEDNTRYSNRLLVNAIDESARDCPDQVVVRYPGPNWETDGYETITRKQLAQAVDRAAHWLDQQLEGAEDAHTVSYVGPNDPRYCILLASTIKTGRRVRPASLFHCLQFVFFPLSVQVRHNESLLSAVQR